MDMEDHRPSLAVTAEAESSFAGACGSVLAVCALPSMALLALAVLHNCPWIPHEKLEFMDDTRVYQSIAFRWAILESCPIALLALIAARRCCGVAWPWRSANTWWLWCLVLGAGWLFVIPVWWLHEHRYELSWADGTQISNNLVLVTAALWGLFWCMGVILFQRGGRARLLRAGPGTVLWALLSLVASPFVLGTVEWFAEGFGLEDKGPGFTMVILGSFWVVGASVAAVWGLEWVRRTYAAVSQFGPLHDHGV
jgi:hypothetical protein